MPNIIRILNLDTNKNNNIALIQGWLDRQENSRQNSYFIIQKLQEIERIFYQPLMQHLAIKEDVTSLANLNSLSQIFADLATLHILIGDYSIKPYKKSLIDLISLDLIFNNSQLSQSSDSDKIYSKIQHYLYRPSPLKYYCDAAMFYQYEYKIKQQATKIILNKIFTNHQPLVASAELNKINAIICSYLQEYAELPMLKQKMLAYIYNQQQVEMPNSVVQETILHKKTLSELRDKTKQQLTLIDSINKVSNQEYAVTAEELFLDITFSIKSFLSYLCRQAQQEMSLRPPCEYALIGLGSMALSQMTTYSDIEFAILTENNDYENNLKTKDYFKDLSHLIHFKVINIGETVLPYSRYNINFDNFIASGLSFDLGGKTPLGRIEGDKLYNLIGTPDDLLQYVKNINNKSEHIDKNLPFILEKVTNITGNAQLTTRYQNLVANFLQQTSNEGPFLKNHQLRALKVLKEGTVEINHLQNPNKPPIKAKSGDLAALELSFDNVGDKLFNVKQEIYRLPDRLIYGLGMYFNEVGKSVWSTILNLEAARIINSDAVRNLQYAATFATVLRLKTYIYYQKQQEDISLFAIGAEDFEFSEDLGKLLHLDINDLNDNGSLFKYFYTALPLHKQLKLFCDLCIKLDSQSQNNFFTKTTFYEDNAVNKGLIYYRLLNYQQAQKYLKKAIREPGGELDLQVRTTLSAIYYKYGNYTEALAQVNYCYGAQDVNNLYRTALIHYSNEEYGESIQLLEQALKIASNDKNIAYILVNIGNNYLAQHKYYDARDCYAKALAMTDNSHQNHYDIARYLINLGSVNIALGEYQIALKNLKRGLAINSSLYKNEPHPILAQTLVNLGLAYYKIDDYDQAICFYKRAIKMLDVLYKDDNPEIAITKNNLGVTYLEQGKKELALPLFKEVLTINQKLFSKSDNHPKIAESYLYLAQCYTALKLYDDAENSLNSANSIAKTPEHKEYIYAAYGNNSFKQSRYQEAGQYFLKSLKIQQDIYDTNHHRICGTLHKLGLVYKAMHNYSAAETYLKQSLDKYQIFYQGKFHFNIAKVEQILGTLYYEQQKYPQAKAKFAESLQTQCATIIKNYNYDKHQINYFYNLPSIFFQPDIAISLSKLALTHSSMNDHNKALEYHYKALFLAAHLNDDAQVIRFQDTEKIIFGFATHYGFHKQQLYNEVINSTPYSNCFINYDLHYNKAIVLQQNNANLTAIIHECKLACALAPLGALPELYPKVSKLLHVAADKVESYLFGELGNAHIEEL